MSAEISPEKIRKIADWLMTAKSAIAFTGAGISTESGIPDYRSPNGVWATSQPVYFDDFLANESARYEYWRQKSITHFEFSKSSPNVGHKVLTQWEAGHRLSGVITQNIDGLHQIAGSKNVLELHGTARKVSCLDCGAIFEADPLVREFLEKDRVPLCPKCAGRIKHATISFGQRLNSDVLEQAAEWSESADVFLVLGSSLVVHPAASLPQQAKTNNAVLVIVNRDPTPLDAIADFVIRDSIGQVLSAIDQQLAAS